jgi:predicted alpha/beta-fold hydrolase
VKFRPFPLLANPHLQTLVGNLLSLAREPRSVTKLVTLPDGDRLALEVSTPDVWREADPTVVLVHGLCGSHRSTYLVRLAAKLFARGVRAVRLNLRGNGTGVGLARRPYHAGCSDDVRVALEALRAETPRSPITLAGFSLGGNIALKLAGELGQDAPALFERVVGVCPAVDLMGGWRRISRQPLYHRHFVRLLLREMQRRHAVSGEPCPTFSPWVSLFDFDDGYTAPHWGYAGAEAYYDAASARDHLPRIAVPCRVLLAEDDPIIDSSCWEQRMPAAAELIRSPRGGHLGFVGAPAALARPDVRFMDDVVLRWAL